MKDEKLHRALDKFLKEGKPTLISRSVWLVGKYSEAYMRKSGRPISMFEESTKDEDRVVDCFDVGSVSVNVKMLGNGIMTAFLEYFGRSMPEAIKYIYIENVLNKRWARWLERNGWKETAYGSSKDAPCFFKKVTPLSKP